MMPNTSVSPAAIRNSVPPNWMPFSTCSTTRTTSSRPRSPSAEPGRDLPLHPALLRVGILVILEHRLLDAHLELAARAGDGTQQVEVLDGEVVHVVRVLAARRRVVGLPHGGDHALL